MKKRESPPNAFQIVLDRVALAVCGHRGGGLCQIDDRAPADGQQEIAFAELPAAKLGRQAVHVRHFRLVRERRQRNFRHFCECRQRNRLDAFGAQRCGDFEHHAAGRIPLPAANQPRPAAERPRPAAHLAASPPAKDDPLRRNEVVEMIGVHDEPLERVATENQCHTKLGIRDWGLGFSVEVQAVRRGD